MGIIPLEEGPEQHLWRAATRHQVYNKDIQVLAMRW
jgi:hypothetical protein